MAPSVPRRLVFAAAWLLTIVALMPTVVTIPAAFTSNDYLSLPSYGNYSFKHLGAFVLPENRWISSFVDSAIIAVFSCVLSVGLAIPLALALWRIGGWVGQALLYLTLMPMMVPLVALGLGTYSVWVKIGLFDSYTGLVIAHAVQAIPFAVIPILGTLAHLDRNLERAAASLGASTFAFIRDVVLPALRPAMLPATALAFMVSWTELVVALFATGRDITTLPKRLWSSALGGSDPVAAVAVGVMTLVTALLLFGRLAVRKK